MLYDKYYVLRIISNRLPLGDKYDVGVPSAYPRLGLYIDPHKMIGCGRSCLVMAKAVGLNLNVCVHQNIGGASNPLEWSHIEHDVSSLRGKEVASVARWKKKTIVGALVHNLVPNCEQKHLLFQLIYHYYIIFIYLYILYPKI